MLFLRFCFNCTLISFFFCSASALHSHPEHTTPGHNLQNRQQTSFQENVSRSLSPHRRRRSEDRKEKQDKRFSPARPQSPLHHHGSESRRERRSGRSRSPHTSKHTHRCGKRLLYKMQTEFYGIEMF